MQFKQTKKQGRFIINFTKIVCLIIQYAVIPIHQKLLSDFIPIIRYPYFRNLSREKESFGDGCFISKLLGKKKKEKILS